MCRPPCAICLLASLSTTLRLPHYRPLNTGTEGFVGAICLPKKLLALVLCNVLMGPYVCALDVRRSCCSRLLSRVPCVSTRSLSFEFQRSAFKRVMVTTVLLLSGCFVAGKDWQLGPRAPASSYKVGTIEGPCSSPSSSLKWHCSQTHSLPRVSAVGPLLHLQRSGTDCCHLVSWPPGSCV